MEHDEIESIVRSRRKPSTLPSEPLSLAKWQAVERYFGCELPPELFHLQVLAARYCFHNDHLPATEILRCYDTELQHNQFWEADFIPFFAVGNGDFLCVRRSEGAESGVYYVAHDDPDTQLLHSSVGEYIRDAEWFG